MSRDHKIEIMGAANGWLVLVMDWDAEKGAWIETECFVHQQEEALFETVKEKFKVKLCK